MKNNKLFNQVLEAIPVACKYASSGCSLQMGIKDKEKHEKICHFREDTCIACAKTIFHHKLNDHFIIAHSSRNSPGSVLYKSQITSMDFTKFQGSHCLRYNNEIEAHFLERYFPDNKNEKFDFSLQYIGKREDADKFYYEIKIDQEFPKKGQSFFTCTGMCMPYTYKRSDWQNDKRSITLNLRQIFVNREIPKNFDLETTIYQM